MNTKSMVLNPKALQELIIALGTGIAVWGAINLLNGYEQDDPALRELGMKQILAGGSVSAKAFCITPDGRLVLPTE